MRVPHLRFALYHLLLPLLLLASSVTGCFPDAANASTEAGRLNVGVSRLAAAGDTVYLAIRWTGSVVTDGRGPVDSYRVTATKAVPAPLVTLSVTTPTTSALIAIPTGLTGPGTASGQVCVQSVRRTLTSPAPGACAPWTVTFADAPPPNPTGVTVDTVRLSLGRSTDSVTLVLQVPGAKLRSVIASGACASSGVTCLAALTTGPDTLRPGCGSRMETTVGRSVYAVRDPDTTSTEWLDCKALAVAYGGTPTVAVNALRSLGFTYR